MELKEIPTPESINEYMGIIQSTINEMSEMVENMHDLSLLNNYTQQLAKKKYKINQLILNIYKRWNPFLN